MWGGDRPKRFSSNIPTTANVLNDTAIKTLIILREKVDFHYASTMAHSFRKHLT